MESYVTCACLPKCSDLPDWSGGTTPGHLSAFLSATYVGIEDGLWNAILTVAILLSMVWVADSGHRHGREFGDFFHIPKSYHLPCGITFGLGVWLAFFGIHQHQLFASITLGRRLLIGWSVHLKTITCMQLSAWILWVIIKANKAISGKECIECRSISASIWSSPSPPPTTSTTETPVPVPTATTDGPEVSASAEKLVTATVTDAP